MLLASTSHIRNHRSSQPQWKTSAADGPLSFFSKRSRVSTSPSVAYVAQVPLACDCCTSRKVPCRRRLLRGQAPTKEAVTEDDPAVYGPAPASATTSPIFLPLGGDSLTGPTLDLTTCTEPTHHASYNLKNEQSTLHQKRAAKHKQPTAQASALQANLVAVVGWLSPSRNARVGGNRGGELHCDLGVRLQLVRAVNCRSTFVALSLELFECCGVVSIGVRQSSNHDSCVCAASLGVNGSFHRCAYPPPTHRRHFRGHCQDVEVAKLEQLQAQRVIESAHITGCR